MPSQPLTWNEMRSRANAFVAEWRSETRERAEAQSFWNDWFAIFGLSRRRFVTFEQHAQRISTGRSGSLDAFWPGVIAIEHKSAGKSLQEAMDQALDYLGSDSELDLPKIVVASDFANFMILDLESNSTTLCPLQDLPDKLDLFAFVAGYQQRTWEEEPQANVKAAELMAHLFDSLEATRYPTHDLTQWLVRILFCMFADDTGLWERGLFQDLIANTREDGRDLGGRINDLFEVLNTPDERRYTSLDDALARFPYVNGGLFEHRLPPPQFTGATRLQLMASCSFDWSAVSPAVFGSMFQAVLDAEERRHLGAHYTSEQSILKALEPLFLDDLRLELSRCRNANQLRAFCRKLSRIKIFDPACGCGNFLVTAYRELRRLELDALVQIRRLTGNQQQQFITEQSGLSVLDVDQFYGIEIEEFPARIAEVALYLVDHQANMELSREFGEYLARIPLKATPHIVRGNALRIEWTEILDPNDCTYLVGNPPFVGKKARTEGQKADMSLVFGAWPRSGNLDYVASWYVKTWNYIKNTEVRAALVSTNSICQGEQVAILWPQLLDAGLRIEFAHRTFRWTSDARGQAAVHVIIIGFSASDVDRRKILFDHPNADGSVVTIISAANINPYLVDAPNVVVDSRRAPLAQAPIMRFGSMPNDDGYLLLTDEEAEALRKDDFVAAKYLRRLIGSRPMLHSIPRWCVWAEDVDPGDVRRSPELSRRADAIRSYREDSNRLATQAAASYPLRFAEIRQPTSRYLCIPRHSAENRRYVPMAFYDRLDIAHDSTMTIDGADDYIFGILSSDMFTSWLSTVGGRIKSDYRLSAEVVYNTFPFPGANETQRDAVSSAALGVLEARSKYPEASLADLYDPRSMPAGLTDAHATLDKAVRRLFQVRATLATDLARQTELFARYVELVAPFRGIRKGR